MGKIVQSKGSTLTKDSFEYDATKIWNNAPESIRTAKSLNATKTDIKNYCITLPM